MKSFISWLNIIAVLWYGLLGADVNTSKWVATFIFSVVMLLFAMAIESSTNTIEEETDGQ